MNMVGYQGVVDKKLPDIPQRIEEDYHSIKDDIPLVSVYTTGNVLVREMLIPDAFLTAEILVEGNKDDDDDSGDRLEPKSHKDKPEYVDDDDDKGALRRMCRRQGYMIQNMEQKCVTTKQFWKTHKQVNQVLHEGVSQLAKKAIEDLIENNLKPCIDTTIYEDRDAFRLEVLDLVSQEFNAQAPNIIEELFKNYVQSNVIQVYPTTTTSTETPSSADLQQQLYFKMKRSLQDQANDPALWEVLKCKFEKSSTSNTSCRDVDIHS
ncbi:hypothetical protein Tco_0007249, partial [Tanacetum coccineum]